MKPLGLGISFLGLALLAALTGCGHSEQEWGWQLSKLERADAENQSIRAELEAAKKDADAARMQAAGCAEREAHPPAPPPEATAPPPPLTPVAPPAPPPTDVDNGISLTILRDRIKAGNKPEPVIIVGFKAFDTKSKLSVERIDGPCELDLDGIHVRATAKEPGECKGRVIAVSSAGTQRTAKEFSLKVRK